MNGTGERDIRALEALGEEFARVDSARAPAALRPRRRLAVVAIALLGLPAAYAVAQEMVVEEGTPAARCPEASRALAELDVDEFHRFDSGCPTREELDQLIELMQRGAARPDAASAAGSGADLGE